MVAVGNVEGTGVRKQLGEFLRRAGLHLVEGEGLPPGIADAMWAYMMHAGQVLALKAASDPSLEPPG